ncbi:hypothetical protein BRC86_13115 [Halobacteriales archaeon QS_3_64_16]|nr:MAG: hypothetical protein BRC86_13115 [Halobacteriales archaeon QS_3_64_16]
MASLFTEFAVSTALGSVLVFGAILFLALRGALDREHLRPVAVLGAVVLLGAFLLALVPDGPISSITTMAVGGAAGYVVIQVVAD